MFAFGMRLKLKAARILKRQKLYRGSFKSYEIRYGALYSTDSYITSTIYFSSIFRCHCTDTRSSVSRTSLV